MLEYIKGSIAGLTPTAVTLETSAGIAFQLNITLQAFSRLENAEGVQRMYVHEVIREDQWLLFGFVDDREREMFRLLIGVSGVGANTARLILSSIAAPELGQVIASGDAGRLKAVKGVGAKTAQRIIVDLKDKINVAEDTLIEQLSTATSEVQDEALAALVMLGFTRQQSMKVLKKIFASTPDIKVEAAIKQALAMM